VSPTSGSERLASSTGRASKLTGGRAGSSSRLRARWVETRATPGSCDRPCTSRGVRNAVSPLAVLVLVRT
jgi:hypothetical protein